MNFKAFLAFLVQYYDRFITGIVMLALVIFIALLVSRVGELRSQISQQDSRPGKIDPAKSYELEDLKNSLAMVDTPPGWSSNSHRLFIAPYMKVLKPEEYPYPTIYDSKITIGLKTSEGLPYEWLKKYGLSTKNLVADTDPDGDGFTVREEFLAETNPVDGSSKPDVALKLRLEKITQKPFPFIFNGVADGAEGLKFSILRRDGKKNYYCKLNEEIPDANDKGFKIMKYEPKTKEVPDPTIKDADGKPLVTTVDVSELTLQREGGNPVILIKGKQGTADDLFARLYFILEDRYIDVGSTSALSLQGIKYQVVSIKKLDATHFEVIVKRLDNGKETILLQLKPEEIKSPTGTTPFGQPPRQLPGGAPPPPVNRALPPRPLPPKPNPQPNRAPAGF